MQTITKKYSCLAAVSRRGNYKFNYKYYVFEKKYKSSDNHVNVNVFFKNKLQMQCVNLSKTYKLIDLEFLHFL